MISGTNEASLPAGFCPLSPIPSASLPPEGFTSLSLLIFTTVFHGIILHGIFPLSFLPCSNSSSCFPLSCKPSSGSSCPVTMPGVLGGSCSGSLRYLKRENNSSLLFYYLTDLPSTRGNLISSRWLPSVQFHRNGPADFKSFYSLLLVLVIGLWETNFGCSGHIQWGLEYLHGWDSRASLSDHVQCWTAVFGWCLCPLLLVLSVSSVQVHPPSRTERFWYIRHHVGMFGVFLSCYKWSDTLFIKSCISSGFFCLLFIRNICLDFWTFRCNSEYSFLNQAFFKILNFIWNSVHWN